MSKKKRNVFNLPEALYRGILEDVRNDPNLYVNPDPTVHEDIHYLAYTLYAQRPSDSELSRNYILALGELGNLCDDIERRTGKLVPRSIIDAAKAQVEKDKKARHAKEAEAHKNDKDFFGNPKPYVHKYWLYEEETEDTLALIELLKAYYSGKISSFDDEEEEVELTKHKKSGKNKKKKVPEPVEELANEDFDDDEDEDDSDEDDDADDDEDDEDFEVGGFHINRGRNYRAELVDALDDEDDEDDEDDDDLDDDEDDEEDEDEDDDDDRPTLRVPEIFKRPNASVTPIPKAKPADPFEDVESDEDEDDDDLDSVDLEAEQAEFDAWVARQNPDEVTVDIGSMAASSNSHRLADSDDELSDDDDEDEEDDDDEEDEKEEIPDDPYAKVRHLIPAGMEPDDYHRLIMRALAGAISYARNKPESNNTMKPDELFAYYSLKNPEATIKCFKDIPAYAPYLDKYLPGWNKGKVEAPKKENAPVAKEAAPVKKQEAPAKKPVEKVKAEIVEEAPIKKPDINKPMTPAEFNAYAQGMVAEAKAKAAKEVEAYKKFRAEHPWPVKDDTKPGSPVVEIVEEEPEKVEVVDETKPEELEKDEITFASGPRLTPDEADAIMDRAFGDDDDETDEDELDETESDDDVPDYYQMVAMLDTEGDCDHIFKIGDGLNVVSINLDYLDDSDPDVVESKNPMIYTTQTQIRAGFYTWIQETFIHYRPSIILTVDEYNSMMSNIACYDTLQYTFFKLGTKYVACYNLTEESYDALRDLIGYLENNNMLTSFFKKYIKIVSDLDGFSFLNTNKQYPWMMTNILNSDANSQEMKDAFISDFKKTAIDSDPEDNMEPITFNDLDASVITGSDDDKVFYESVLNNIYALTHGISSVDDDDDDDDIVIDQDDTEQDTEVGSEDTSDDVGDSSTTEENPNQEMVNAANTLFTLTADKKVDLDDVGMVARKLQDFVNKEVAEARGKLNPEELVEDDSDDEEEDDDDIEEEYFPNRRKEVKKASNPIKKPVQKPQKKNDDDDPNAFVIQRR